MKKLVFFSAVITAFAFTSCSKCKKCTIQTSTETEGIWVTQSVEEKFCEPDIPEEGTITVGVPGTQVQTSITCK